MKKSVFEAENRWLLFLRLVKNRHFVVMAKYVLIVKKYEKLKKVFSWWQK